MTTDKVSCRILAEVLAEGGVKNVVISPGSRNTPLILAFDACQSIKKHVVLDERSAAFVALGMAKTLQRPVALVCTSGTALLNYSPAVAEAYYSRIPLIVISADRPIQWIDQDDSQTLRQFEALSNFVLKSYDIPEFASGNSVMERYANRIANDALITATASRPGPVHINIQFDAPLSKLTELPAPDKRVISVLRPDNTLSSSDAEQLCKSVEGKKILLIAGFLPPDDKLNRAVAMLATLPQVYVMYETISNLHLQGNHHAIDLILTDLSQAEKQSLKPDIVISIGGALVSRYIKEYLREIRPEEHWSIGISDTTVDCFLSLTRRIEVSPARILRKLAGHLKHHPIKNESLGYAKLWNEVKRRAYQSHDEYIRRAPWSDLIAYKCIFHSLPKDCNLHLSNGTSIRYAQLLQDVQPHACYCNRGVSGIDGSTSTAIGGAMAYSGMTVLLTGDMSFAYDIGALSLTQIPNTLRIIVIRNGGGGIFRFIPSTRNLPQREEYFCSMPKLPLKELSHAYGFDYYEASDEQSLNDALHKFYAPSSAPAILEVNTPGAVSGDVLAGYMKRSQ